MNGCTLSSTSLVTSSTTHHSFSKVLIYPEVDEEVGEVVDVDAEEEVARKRDSSEKGQQEGQVADDCENEQTCPYFHRLYVLCFFLH